MKDEKSGRKISSPLLRIFVWVEKQVVKDLAHLGRWSPWLYSDDSGFKTLPCSRAERSSFSIFW